MTCKTFLAILIIFFIGGCAAVQKPVDIKPEFWSDKTRVVGIAVAKIPQADTYETGGMGVLDIIIVEGVMKPLTTHLKSLDFSEFYKIKVALNDTLTNKNIKTFTIDEPLDLESFTELQNKDGFALHDFSGLKEKYNIDDLLLININRLGTTRSYYGFLPTSDPQAFINAFGQLINLNDNSLIWHYNEEQINTVNGEWDEQETGYPNLTNSIYQSLDTAKTNIVNSFNSQ